MIYSIFDLRPIASTFWLAILTPRYRFGDYAERDGHVSVSTHLALTAEEVGQLLGGN